MPGVKIRDNETFESAFKRFKRLVEQEKVLSEIKKHQRYEKPSERRKKKAIASRKRNYRQYRSSR